MRCFFKLPSLICAAILTAAALSGCGAAAPAPTSSVLTMNFTPALQPFGAVFQTCTRLQPGLSLLVNELPAGQIDQLPADIFLVWGDAEHAGRTPYQTGVEELVFIVNPANPLTAIPIDMLSAVLSGQAATWDALLPPVCEECSAGSPDPAFSGAAIQVWTYPPDDEALRALSGIPSGTRIPPYSSRLAPDPEAMRLAVSQEPGAFGFIPRRWLDESVKILEVRGLADGALRRPILAYPSDPLSTESSQFISCLQQVLNP